MDPISAGNVGRTNMPIHYSFGDFEFEAKTGALKREGKPILIGSRAVMILRTLIDRRDECVSNAELLAAGWPNVQVEEANVRVHIAALRKALGDHEGFIANTVGRGYQFIGPLSVVETIDESLPAPAVRSNLPAAPTRLFGREETIACISSAIASHSVVTISGTGGVGKTSVAVDVAHHWELAGKSPVIFIDLSTVSDPSRVYAAVATTLSIPSTSDDMLSAIVNGLRIRTLLLILDNCEHLVETVAPLVEALVEETEVKLLATSREPLRVRNEMVHRLAPLPFPAGGSTLTAAEAVAFPAVAFFVQRARSVLHTFEITDGTAQAVAEICRRLDGNPLAIEFAAARVESFDAKGLAFALGRRLSLLTQGRRTAPSRQTSLRATLDWSYRLLTPDQQSVLRQLAAFSGGFRLADAEGMLILSAESPSVFDAVAELVAKSLMSVDLSGEDAIYRLLESIREYALEKLQESGEFDDVRSRHAAHLVGVFLIQDVDWNDPPSADVMRFYRMAVDNVRTAIDWTLLQPDEDVGIRLTAASAPMWFHLGLIFEYQERLRVALQRLEARDDADPLHEMQMQCAFLQCAFAVVLFVHGHLQPEMIAAGERGLKLAEQLGEIRYQLRVLSALTGASTLNAEYVKALSYAEQFKKTAARSSDINAIHASNRLMALQSTLAGRHLAARSYCEMALDTGAIDVSGRRNTFVYDHMPVARATLARVLWLQGFPDSALREADQAVAETMDPRQAAIASFVMITGAIPVAFWSGNWELAKERVAAFHAHAVTHNFLRWQSYGKLFDWVLSIATIEPEDAPIVARIWSPNSLPLLEFLGSFHPSLVRPEAIVPIATCDERWCAPEMLRALGEQIAAPGCRRGLAKAEEMFVQSVRLAAKQGALAWELRSATSLARLLNRQGRKAEAIDSLAPVYEKFTEGFETRELLTARKVMEASRTTVE